MILADKITMLRKRSGWSQEELAERLGVSRQAVSKWESGTSLPDLDRIIKMSELFCVSTDYLLKDEVQEITLPEGDGVTEPSGGYDLSLEEANAFLELTRRLSSRMAAAIALLVLSPVCLIQLGAVAEFRKTSLTEGMAAGIGLSVLLVLVAIGVGLLIFDGMKLSRYRHLEEKDLTLQYGVKGLVERRRQADESGYRASVVAGVVLCILGVIPLLLAGTMDLGDYITTSCVSLLLVLVAVAVFLFVRFGNIWSSYKKSSRRRSIPGSRSRPTGSCPGSRGFTGWWSRRSIWPSAFRPDVGISPGLSGRWRACSLRRCTPSWRFWSSAEMKRNNRVKSTLSERVCSFYTRSLA